MKTYLAVKMDVRDSQKVKDRRELQRKLFQATIEVNQRHSRSIQSRFIVTHGDEVQGLMQCEGARELVSIVEYYAGALRPARVRFGVGFGELSTDLQPDAIGMDGQAWHRAKEAIEHAEKNHSFILFRGFGQETEKVLDGLANLLFFVASRWTENQRRVISLVEEGLKQSEVADRVSISDAAVSKHMRAAGWREYREGREALRDLLDKSVLAKHPEKAK